MRITHCGRILAGEGGNGHGIAGFECGALNQFTAHANSRRARQQVLRGVIESHSSGWDQGNLWQSGFQCLDISWAADVSARKNFDEIGTGAPTL